MDDCSIHTPEAVPTQKEGRPRDKIGLPTATTEIADMSSLDNGRFVLCIDLSFHVIKKEHEKSTMECTLACACQPRQWQDTGQTK
jgi:hypothetical protein